MAPPGVAASRVIMIGLGDADLIDELAAQSFGGKLGNLLLARAINLH